MTLSSSARDSMSDDTLAMVLDEVSAAIVAQRPMMQGLVNLDRQALGSARGAVAGLQERLNQGQGEAEAIAALSTTYQAPLRIAMKLLVESRSGEPVYEVIRLIRRNKQYRHNIIVSSISPLINVSVAATVLFFVMPWVLKALAEMELIRARLSPTATEIGETFTRNFLIGTSVTLLVIGAGVLMVAKAVSGIRSGKDLHRDLATFCRWIAIQIQPAGDRDPSDSEQKEASKSLAEMIADASEVVGPSFSQAWRGVRESLEQGGRTAEGLMFPEGTPQSVQQCIVDLVSGNRDSRQVSQDLRSLSDLYEHQSQRRRDTWTILLPRCLSWVIVLSIVALLTHTILMPLVDVIIEVAS